MPQKIKPRKKCKHCNNLCERRDTVYCRECIAKHIYNTKHNLAAYTTDYSRGNWLRKIYGNRCFICDISNWENVPLKMELDHIDGNYTNNIVDNLRLLCPNCHAQTDTYKNKNKGRGRYARRKNALIV